MQNHWSHFDQTLTRLNIENAFYMFCNVHLFQEAEYHYYINQLANSFKSLFQHFQLGFHILAYQELQLFYVNAWYALYFLYPIKV